jgi:hypothetical protein
MKNQARKIFSMKRSRFTDQQIAFAMAAGRRWSDVPEIMEKLDYLPNILLSCCP